MENSEIFSPPEQENPSVAEEKRKKAVWGNSNFTFGGVILYLGLMFAVIFAWMIVDMVSFILNNPDLREDIDGLTNAFVTRELSSGWSSIASIVVGNAALLIYFRKRVRLKDIFSDRKPLSIPHFLLLLCIFMSGQFIATCGNALLEMLLNLFGYTSAKGSEMLENLDSSISMILYAGIFGPVAEELVFRGFVMRGLEKHGKLFAITLSSLLFGLFHGNIVQIPFAALIGLVFAYVAMEYGIKWSIALHILNNLCFAILMMRISRSMSETAATALELGLEGLFFILGIIAFIVLRREFAGFIRENRTQKPNYRLAFTTPCFIVFTIGSIILTGLTITRI